MKVHVLQHVPFEGLAAIEPWLARHGAEISFTRFFDGHTPESTLPDPDSIDFVIALGGPMSVNDEAMLPWLVPEKRFVRDAIGAGKAVLGICLGAQLIASSLGCRVFPGREKEIGWFPIEGTEHPSGLFAFPPSSTVFHWHGETFELPSGAFHLARSEGCENQAFQLGQRVVALQFHLEMTAASIASIAEQCADELVPGRFVETREALMAGHERHGRDADALLDRLLRYLTRGSV